MKKVDADCEDMKAVLMFLKMTDVMNKLTLTKGTSMKEVKVKEGELKGFDNLLPDLADKYPNCKKYAGESPRQRALIRQWLHYILSNVRGQSSVSESVLKELDSNLVTTTYFGGHCVTLIDPVLYVSLYPTYTGMNMYEKEKYTNLSRWFRLMQENDTLRKGNKKLVFSNIPLYKSLNAHP